MLIFHHHHPLSLFLRKKISKQQKGKEYSGKSIAKMS